MHTKTELLIEHVEGAAGEQHGRCEEEEVQLRVCVQNSADEVVVRVRPEKVDLSGHRGLVELPEKMRRCAVHVRELAVASSALGALPEWLGELVRLEVLCLGHATVGVGSKEEMQTRRVRQANRAARRALGAEGAAHAGFGRMLRTERNAGETLGAYDTADTGSGRV